MKLLDEPSFYFIQPMVLGIFLLKLMYQIYVNGSIVVGSLINIVSVLYLGVLRIQSELCMFMSFMQGYPFLVGNVNNDHVEVKGPTWNSTNISQCHVTRMLKK